MRSTSRFLNIHQLLMIPYFYACAQALDIYFDSDESWKWKNSDVIEETFESGVRISFVQMFMLTINLINFALSALVSRSHFVCVNEMCTASLYIQNYPA